MLNHNCTITINLKHIISNTYLLFLWSRSRGSKCNNFYFIFLFYDFLNCSHMLNHNCAITIKIKHINLCSNWPNIFFIVNTIMRYFETKYMHAGNWLKLCRKKNLVIKKKVSPFTKGETKKSIVSYFAVLSFRRLVYAVDQNLIRRQNVIDAFCNRRVLTRRCKWRVMNASFSSERVIYKIFKNCNWRVMTRPLNAFITPHE